MYLLPIIAVLFALGALFNLVGREVPVTHEAAFGLGLAVLYGLVFLYLRRCEQEERALVDALEDGPDGLRGTFRGVELHDKTPVVRHPIVVSFLFVTVNEEPGVRLEAQGSGRRGLAYGLICLLFGWWSLPRGPIDTLAALKTNLTGGRRTTLQEHLRRRERELEEG